jgi:hypothetical protein
MTTAYTPGLTVAARARVRKERRLPLKGEVLVAAGDRVQADTIVARAELPGRVHTLKLSERLGVEPEEVKGLLKKAMGEAVEKGELIAESRGLFGLFRTEVRSPAAGRIEHLSEASGYLSLREHPRPLEVDAHFAGEVKEIIPGEGVLIETEGALVQGIFGVGGESRGKLWVAAGSAEESLRPDQLDGRARGAIIVGGASARGDTLAAAAALGAAGMVVGGLSDSALRSFVGYDIGVAITGQEPVPFPLIVTEGFGELPMAERTYRLLKEREGKLASLSGATQIRAGVIRPEIIIPELEAGGLLAAGAAAQSLGGQLELGARVRIIRQPHFGELAEVVALPADLREIETEARVRVVELRLKDGTTTAAPRANVEMISS